MPCQRKTGGPQTEKHKLSATPTSRTELTFQYFDDDGRLEVVNDWGTNRPSGFTLQEERANWGSEAYPAKPSASDSSALVTKYAYDDMGRTTSVTDPKATVTATTYDDLSRATQVVEDSGGGRIARTTSYSYDALGLLTKMPP